MTQRSMGVAPEPESKRGGMKMDKPKDKDKKRLSKTYYCEACDTRLTVEALTKEGFLDQMVRYCPVCQDVCTFKKI